MTHSERFATPSSPTTDHRPPTALPPAYRLILDAVRFCPDRGSVLPHTRQPECGCAELTDCRAGRGRAGAVTLEECVRCRCAALGIC